jgi:hypothetical protein
MPSTYRPSDDLLGARRPRAGERGVVVLGVVEDRDLSTLAGNVCNVVGEQRKAGNHGRGGRVELHLVDSITAM